MLDFPLSALGHCWLGNNMGIWSEKLSVDVMLVLTRDLHVASANWHHHNLPSSLDAASFDSLVPALLGCDGILAIKQVLLLYLSRFLQTEKSIVVRLLFSTSNR